MSNPVRVLQVLGSTNLGGAESRVMDIYRNIDRNKIQFDFMVHTSEPGFYDEEIKQLGGNIYCVPKFRIYNIVSYKKAWKNFFNEHGIYQTVHGHMTSTASLYLPIAKKAGVLTTVAHARSAGTDPGIKGFLTRVLRRNLAKKTDYCFTCSNIAGIAVFGKKEMQTGHVTLIPNAINSTNFIFNQTTREQIRRQYNLEGKFVLGHVGRFHYAKNHKFLIEIFSKVLNLEPASILMLVGEGPLESSVREQVRLLGIQDKVIFTGNQKNIYDYYQGMDFFVFPSHFEGLPGSVVEAQAAGLKVIMSDTIADEVKITALVQTLSIQETSQVWAEHIVKSREYVRRQDCNAIVESGFDVCRQVQFMEKFYLTGKLDKEN